MDGPTNKFDRVIGAIDQANREDPNTTETGGSDRPAELVYSERMTQKLEVFFPGASEELQIAARGQHVRRWTSKRAGLS